MRLHSVKLSNYKSFGDSDFSKVIIEPSVTVIIGKNESGKSNIVEGLSKISFFERKSTAFSNEILNRNCENGGAIKYEVELKSSDAEMQTYHISEDSVAILTEESCFISGGFYELYSNVCSKSFAQFAEYINHHLPQTKKLEDINMIKKHSQALQASDRVDTWAVNAAVKYFEKMSARFSGVERNEYSQMFESVKINFDSIMTVLPTIFFRSDKKVFKNEYKLDEVQKELSADNAIQNSMLYCLLKVIDITNAEFIEAMKAGISGTRGNLRKKIQKAINEKINEPFHKFYEAEIINLDVDFDSNIAKFFVSAKDGTAMLLSERSEGLRWYLNMFIDACAQEQSLQHTVYVFDEPGISLHVNAQRKLRELFKTLANTETESQVIYTTHSPYMLDVDENGVERIRAVVKDECEISKIYKTAYDSRISPICQEDTLTPVITALGMSLSDTFGPANNKFNIVTEGVSDTIFLRAMANQLDINISEYALIPVVGAPNCVNVSLILHGWGCKNIVIFDYDKAGVESGGNVLSDKYGYEHGKHYLYVKDCTQEDISQKGYKTDVAVIEDLVPDLQDCLDKFNHQEIDGKPLRAKCYVNALDGGSYSCSQETLDNFRRLFDRIETCAKEQNSEMVYSQQ